MTDLNENTNYTYGELAKEIARMHILFEQMEIQKGDKIALVGTNHSSWVIVFMATITYGAVIVPVLSDYHPESMENIILHSDAKICFIEKGIWKNINKEKITHPVFALPSLQMIQGEKNELVSLHSIIDEKYLSKYPNGFQVEDIKYPEISNDSLICIHYVSGSMGFLKGAMLTGGNYVGNVISLQNVNLISKGESNVVFLPLAHAFGCTFDVLYGLSVGVHNFIINRIRSTQMLIDAFQEVQPKLINIVPLILEKIVIRTKEKIISSRYKKILLRTPVLNRIVYREIRKSLITTFGGNHKEMIVGGACLDEEVEDFLWKIKFPFSVGYGLTECAPVISIDNHKGFVPRSGGKVLHRTMKARIDSECQLTVPGEIQVVGTHVMKGYYKNPEATAATFTEDGWLKTGDLGVCDKKDRLYIKGLLKTMILGSNGQNIFQEEIESRLNKMDYVSESVVIKRNNVLVGLVYPDYQRIENENLNSSDLEKIMEDNRIKLNKMLARYERVGMIEIIENEFERTEDKFIRRSLYV